VRLLLDTHILLWADEHPRLIAQPLLAAMRDPTNELVVSAATIWEIAIKRATGKASLRPTDRSHRAGAWF